MARSLLSPAVIVSVALTVAAGFYAYVYLPFQMRKAYRQSLQTLARAVETKDAGAEGHGERAAQYAVEVAAEMRLPAKDRLKIEHAAVLQGIGNVRVPYAILNKPGQLTAEEFDILKGHTLIGAEMVEQVKFLRDISPTIRHHHEAWDGSGYPDGLSGNEIPLGARILAVCTAFESMLHTRAYRSGLGVDRAISELRAEMGTKYDPAVITAFLKVLKKREYRQRRAA